MKAATTRKKWRPTLSMVVIAVLLSVLLLPFAIILFFRIFEHQIFQQTENALIAQSAVLSAVMSRMVAEQEEIEFGEFAAVEQTISIENGPYKPITPRTYLFSAKTYPRRAKARPSGDSSSDIMQEIGSRLSPLLVETQKVTLAGFRVLDHKGNVIAGRSELGLSLSHIEEVQAALSGEYKSVLRERISDEPAPAFSSLSRGTATRIFSAMPVILHNKVVGVIYASRTPSNTMRQLFKQWEIVAIASAFTLLVTALIGFVFLRVITKPIHELIERTQRISTGDANAIAPLKHNGTREFASLADSFLSMARKISERADYISTFASHAAHELKSPITATKGAVELLMESGEDMSKEQRNRFLNNILKDSDRVTALLDRLRHLARADNPKSTGQLDLENLLDHLQNQYASLEVNCKSQSSVQVPITLENAEIIFFNLVDNAINHAATKVTIQIEETPTTLRFYICDNGSGISEGNAGKIFDLFFTTRRSEGGTGMGLGIVQSMVKSHYGSLTFLADRAETTFCVELPKVLPQDA
ncbi:MULTISPECIES: HAMP domain-containing sensor histidine kinase [unclassified Pseudovibrio]|uniref:sensor histidine kinase n=1 Tax=unclassified Pseudovibrio TaxID=2627060 RepID=UPI0007AED34B|nr:MULTISPECIES: HAMP domain-containing sensor histidine kinase [unclassified Pseudovibrio]KZL02705.1 Sensor protein CreC [Pseudovibrio sp. W74]KZL12374.1 Sensor protein CreC [Pseudovibrio sp. Ad14]